MKGRLIIVFGLPGSGKSYFATRLAGGLMAEYVNSDLVRKSVLKERTYSEAEREGIYSLMKELAAGTLEAGGTVVVDGTFYKESLRKDYSEMASARGAGIVFIEVTAPEALIRERVERKREHSEADYSVYLKVKSEFEPMREAHLVLESGTDNIDAMLERAEGYLANSETGHG